MCGQAFKGRHQGGAVRLTRSQPSEHEASLSRSDRRPTSIPAAVAKVLAKRRLNGVRPPAGQHLSRQSPGSQGRPTSGVEEVGGHRTASHQLDLTQRLPHEQVQTVDDAGTRSIVGDHIHFEQRPSPHPEEWRVSVWVRDSGSAGTRRLLPQ